MILEASEYGVYNLFDRNLIPLLFAVSSFGHYTLVRHEPLTASVAFTAVSTSFAAAELNTYNFGHFMQIIGLFLLTYFGYH
jgi:hypothetical protein